jgi:hypothetical protein
MGENNVGCIVLIIGGFSTLFLWSSKILDFVLGNFRGFSPKK